MKCKRMFAEILYLGVIEGYDYTGERIFKAYRLDSAY